MKEPRVKDIIENYEKGGLKDVYSYLTQDDIVVDPSTWSGNLKRMLDDNHLHTAKSLIEIVSYKFNK